MKKSRKLVLSRETLHSLELRGVAGGNRSLGLCGGGGGTSTTNESNSNYTCTMPTTNQSADCATGGACTVTC